MECARFCALCVSSHNIQNKRREMVLDKERLPINKHANAEIDRQGRSIAQHTIVCTEKEIAL
jgi:hypothetical protein